MALQKRLLFLTLNTFSSTGGIEKVNRIAGKALAEIASETGYGFTLFSMYDTPDQVLEKYVPRPSFRAFSGKRWSMAGAAVAAGRGSHTVILSHVNLLLIGYAIKKLSPKTRVLLIAHGIEVWSPLPRWKAAMLRSLDLILPVSHFTAKKMEGLFGLTPAKIKVLNNCLDPFLQKSPQQSRSQAIRSGFGFTGDDKVLFTLTRLKFSEQYKGYDKVIKALPAIREKCPSVKYLIAGKWDWEEKQRLDKLIESLGLEQIVFFKGFVEDEEIEAFFGATDIYIMPSTGEGFGIVFIEALFYGLPVIAGNMDGSVDALANGRFGLLVNPDNAGEIIGAVEKALNNKKGLIPDRQAVQLAFGFKTYKSNVKSILQLQ